MYYFQRFGHQLDGMKVDIVSFDGTTGTWLVKGTLGEVFAAPSELV